MTKTKIYLILSKLKQIRGMIYVVKKDKCSYSMFSNWMILKDNSVLPFVVYVKSYKEIQPISREKLQAKGIIIV